MKKYFVIGGAGFIGSHLVKELLKEDNFVRIYDNFSSGKMFHLKEVENNENLDIVKADVKNLDVLKESMKGFDIVYHFASNPDIAKAMLEPDIDFWEGTFLTNNVVEAMRLNSVKNILYASGSGVYGDTGYLETDENFSPMLPISTYGASKLACEALICSYCHMFEMNAAVFRFANVVGPNQTHGVGYDFVRKLLKDSSRLEILGNGTQSKSYIYVDDVISAMRIIETNFLNNFNYFNVATQDYITVKEIADLTVKIMDLKKVEYVFTGGDRGWKGDVPVVRLNSNKIRKLGWRNKYSSKEAIELSIKSIYQEALSNKSFFKGETR